MSLLLVNEVFWSLQGEGSMTGRPSVFIRLQGCHNHCYFCDTPLAQSLDHPPLKEDKITQVFEKKNPSKDYALLSPQFLAKEIAKKTNPGWLVVITGGEPCLQDLKPLTLNLEDLGFNCQIETSGSEPINSSPNTWVTLSPKEKGVYKPNWERASEIKLAVGNSCDLERYYDKLKSFPPEKIWLQPIDCSKEATKLCVEVCKSHNWRLSLQMHKYIGIK